MMLGSGLADGIPGIFSTYVMIVGIPMLACRVVSFFLGLGFQSPILHAFVRKTCKWAIILGLITAIIFPHFDESAKQESLNRAKGYVSEYIEQVINDDEHKKILYDKMDKAKNKDDVYKIRNEDVPKFLDIELYGS
ncbi:hypothetical protein ACF3NF_07885 (plasmid) [Anaerococcus martiniensis]|uniref:hypothetical protein n=1 Tax=Anaerococcus sp. WGS1579 TaxID=3366809 RepID=UPI00372D77E4